MSNYPVFKKSGFSTAVANRDLTQKNTQPQGEPQLNLSCCFGALVRRANEVLNLDFLKKYFTKCQTQMLEFYIFVSLYGKNFAFKNFY